MLVWKTFAIGALSIQVWQICQTWDQARLVGTRDNQKDSNPRQPEKNTHFVRHWVVVVGIVVVGDDALDLDRGRVSGIVSPRNGRGGRFGGRGLSQRLVS